MPKTNVLAKVKKIDIQNKIMGDDWKQHITLTLGEIELTDANLIAIRKFRPHEEVMVNLSTLQLSMGDLEQSQRTAMLDKDTDATPAPLSVLIQKPNETTASTPGHDLSAQRDVPLDIMEGEPIEAIVLGQDYEDDVDPNSVVQSFSFR